MAYHVQFIGQAADVQRGHINCNRARSEGQYRHNALRSSFGYQEFFSPRPRALVSEYAFRPVSYSTINPSIVYPESMINLIGGGHVRRRRSGSLVEASPIVRTVNQLDNRRLRVDDPFFIYALQNVLPHHPSAMRASCPVQSRVTDLL
ncbi:hypothetical protein LENED_006447 [Lentinula edodes]|uniref:Uncharacterized protein n=2 Tax=Lentinula edodes TaxID=5353 RepID=A0A1Q3EBU1_LENED|nr:hypothetical protein LENED_006447 [Lentinula edodes]